MDTVHPLVSVITPIYRSEDILARAIGSLLAQDLHDWEAVIVDDGSPEASWRVIQAYSWIDPRIRTFRQVHGGACRSRNAGIAEARGQYILFLDADDWLETDALSNLVGACEREGWVAAHGRLRYVTPEGLPTSWEGGFAGNSDLFEAIAWSNVLSVPSATLLRRSVFDQIGTFDPTIVHCGDWDLWARLARHDGPIGAIDQTVTAYRMRPGSLSRSPKTLLRDAMTVLRRIHGPDPRVQTPLARFAAGADRAMLNSRLCHFAAYAAGLAICGGGFEAAEAVLELVPRWVPLVPKRVGEFIFYAMCFSHCCGPEGAADFWPFVVEPLHLLLAELERRTLSPGFEDAAMAAMDACCEVSLSALPLPLPEPAEPIAAALEPFPLTQDTLAHSTLRTLAALSG